MDLGAREVDLGVREVDLGAREVDLGVREVDLGVREWTWESGSGPGSQGVDLGAREWTWESGSGPGGQGFEMGAGEEMHTVPTWTTAMTARALAAIIALGGRGALRHNHHRPSMAVPVNSPCNHQHSCHMSGNGTHLKQTVLVCKVR